MVVNKTPIFINTGFCFSIQYSIYHTYHFDIPFVEREQFLNFICNCLHLQDFSWWGLGKTWVQEMVYHPIPWWGLPSLDYMMHPQHPPMLFFSSSIEGLFQYFPCFIFMNSSASFLIFFSVEHSLFTVYWTFSPQSLLLMRSRFLHILILFCFTFIIPSFPSMCKHKLVAET